MSTMKMTIPIFVGLPRILSISLERFSKNKKRAFWRAQSEDKPTI